MATYYHSGVNRPVLLGVLARRHASGMVNALSAGEPALVAAYKRYPEVGLVMDSGACQGYRDVDAYARLIKRLGKRMLWCSNMDELHNQQESDERYQRLRHLLADDEDVREKLL